ncbi:GNAT superfamily N-acetyltransferase [Actinoplanes campanulatus]|uniref:GNAT superfamily N-acetyltransferase n=1 Tax=Actinoplanes campanulatus TaxID=113559 RepID=A0A7W5ASX2_9ACTN|nr:GNAT family N-acetyltransferase [Actinoplanes campanulatus]MBB3101602.1 GNAT superfamily N-acetyltransferase [Actinoplanes campanulatus]GGN48718.1 N-acetyltransferase [Actinoplanes campanulatus]GID41678.1 N-acetyltransferase [Actinoplanes campanulatus]
MRIREATVVDADMLGDVHVRTWQEAYRGKISAQYLAQIDLAQRRQGWRRILQNPGLAATLVAEHECQGVVGFIRVSSSRDSDADTRRVGEVYGLYLLPAFWGRGVGRMLMEAGLRRLAQAGYMENTLWVLATNDRARRFYEASGWRPDGATKTDDSHGVPLIEVRYRRTASIQPSV